MELFIYLIIEKKLYTTVVQQKVIIACYFFESIKNIRKLRRLSKGFSNHRHRSKIKKNLVEQKILRVQY